MLIRLFLCNRKKNARHRKRFRHSWQRDWTEKIDLILSWQLTIQKRLVSSRLSTDPLLFRFSTKWIESWSVSAHSITASQHFWPAAANFNHGMPFGRRPTSSVFASAFLSGVHTTSSWIRNFLQSRCPCTQSTLNHRHRKNNDLTTQLVESNQNHNLRLNAKRASDSKICNLTLSSEQHRKQYRICRSTINFAKQDKVTWDEAKQLTVAK